MSFSYSAGSTSAASVYAGMCEFPSLRINDGSFRSLVIPPIIESAPAAHSLASLPGDGEFVGPRRLRSWAFNIEGWFKVDAPLDVQGAVGYLNSKLNVYNGWQTVYFDAPSWSDQRQMRLAVLNVALAQPDKDHLKTTQRAFIVSVVAADPRLYGKTAVGPTAIGTGGTSLTNAGNYETPMTVVFTGPFTSAPRIDGPGTAGTNRLGLTGTVSAGTVITVNTYDSTTGGLTAVDQTGANAMSLLSDMTGRVLLPGASTWTRTGTGTGTIEVTHRPAYSGPSS